MKRREFLAASAAAAVSLVSASATAVRAANVERMWYELRTYHFPSSAKQQAFEQFMEQAAVPAFTRAGVSPVGVWKAMVKDDPRLKEEPTDLYVLLPHKTFDSVITFEQRLAADEAFQTAGKTVLTAPRTDPAFTRYDSTLLLAMEGAPTIQTPIKGPDRVFELRTYLSRTNAKALNKLEMFNKGEFPLFAKCGMPGVFFGGAIAGQDLPQLTYMVAHENIDANKDNWKRFNNDADWKVLSKDPRYQDNVSKAISTFVRPVGGSQI
jgi:hypothetical protein